MSTQTKANLRDVLIGAVVVLFVTSPWLFTHSAWGLDAPNHIWAMWMQGLAIAHTGHPTLYLSAGGMGLGENVGLMEPYYGLYGGTLYALVGTLSAILGGAAVTAFLISIVIFAGMAYRGVWLIARIFGVPPVLSHVPALIFLTSPYYITDLYARGVWPEWTAFSMLPFVLAYGLRLMREQWRPRVVAAFLIGVVLLTGSHNISLLWTLVFVLIFGTASYVVLGKDRSALFERVTPVVGLTVLAVGVNMWFLSMNLVHSRDVKIYWEPFYWDMTKDFNTLGNVLNPFRVTPKASSTNDLIVTTPVLALLVAFVLRIYGKRAKADVQRTLGKVWWVLVAAVVFGVFLMVMPAGIWEFIGRPFTLTQFPYRLSAWATASVVLLLALSLGLAGRPSPKARPFLAGLIGVLVAVTVLQSGLQLFHPSKGGWRERDRHTSVYSRGQLEVPPEWYDQGAYRDWSRPQVQPADANRKIELPIPPAGSTRVTRLVLIPDGPDPIVTNFSGGTWAIKVQGEGIHVVGRNDHGFLTIARNAGWTGTQSEITVTADAGTVGRVGVILSLLSLFGITIVLTTIRERRRRERRDGGLPPTGAAPVTEPGAPTPSAGVSGYAGGW